MIQEPDRITDAWLRSPLARIQPGEVIVVPAFAGTLAEIVQDPAAARARPEALEALEQLVPLLADVIVLSSRPPAQLEHLVPIPGVRLIGDSGLAIPRKAQREALDRFNADTSKLLERIPGSWLEVKPASTAIHFRLTDLTGEQMLKLLQPLLDGARLEAALGRKVIEVHAPKAGKGSAMAALLPGEDPGGVVCFGDDENDRSLFEYVRLRAGGDDHDRQPSLPTEIPQLVDAADQHRQQEQRDQPVLGDHDLGRCQVTDELVAEVGVRRPKGCRHRHQHDRKPVDAYAAARTAGPCHRPPFNAIWWRRLPPRGETGIPLVGPSLRLPDPSPAGLPAPAYREGSTPPAKRPPPRRRPPPPPPRAPPPGSARRRPLPAGRVPRAAACRPTRAGYRSAGCRPRSNTSSPRRGSGCPPRAAAAWRTG